MVPWQWSVSQIIAASRAVVQCQRLLQLGDYAITEFRRLKHFGLAGPREHPMGDLFQSVDAELQDHAAVVLRHDLLRAVPLRLGDDLGRLGGEPDFDVVAFLATIDRPSVAEIAAEIEVIRHIGQLV